MKTFNRTSLPEQIKYNGLVYTRNTGEIPVGCKCVKVLVLQTILKTKRDLFGQPYKPTEWIYISK